jgi:hypothetical protein
MLSLILFIVAVILFLIVAFAPPVPKPNLTALGLAAMAAGLAVLYYVK